MEYLNALLKRFVTEPVNESDTAKQTGKLYDRLRGMISDEAREALMELMDHTDMLRRETRLYAFLCGYRLAEEIRQELARIVPGEEGKEIE